MQPATNTFAKMTTLRGTFYGRQKGAGAAQLNGKMEMPAVPGLKGNGKEKAGSEAQTSDPEEKPSNQPKRTRGASGGGREEGREYPTQAQNQGKAANSRESSRDAGRQ